MKILYDLSGRFRDTIHNLFIVILFSSVMLCEQFYRRKGCKDVSPSCMVIHEHVPYNSTNRTSGRGHSWRVRLAKQETLTPPGHLVSSLVCRGPWMSTVVLYCWCHSDSASVLLYFTSRKLKIENSTCTRLRLTRIWCSTSIRYKKSDL